GPKSQTTRPLTFPNGPAAVRRRLCRLKPLVSQDLHDKEDCGQYSQHHTDPQRISDHHLKLVAVGGAISQWLVSVITALPATHQGVHSEKRRTSLNVKASIVKPNSSLIRSSARKGAAIHRCHYVVPVGRTSMKIR